MSGWAGNLANYGPTGFYEHSVSVYPALLYVTLASWGDRRTAALDVAIKALSIPSTCAWARDRGDHLPDRRSPRRRSGQPRSTSSTPASCWPARPGARSTPRGPSFCPARPRRVGRATACARRWPRDARPLLKPQFGLVLLPVLIVAVAHAVRSDDGNRPLAVPLRWRRRLCAIAVALPLDLDPSATRTSSRATWPSARRVAVRDEPVGAADGVRDARGAASGSPEPDSCSCGLALAVLPLLRRDDLPTLLASGAFTSSPSTSCRRGSTSGTSSRRWRCWPAGGHGPPAASRLHRPDPRDSPRRWSMRSSSSPRSACPTRSREAAAHPVRGLDIGIALIGYAVGWVVMLLAVVVVGRSDGGVDARTSRGRALADLAADRSSRRRSRSIRASTRESCCQARHLERRGDRRIAVGMDADAGGHDVPP